MQKGWKRLIAGAALFAAVAIPGGNALAGTSGAVYDMRAFLAEPHPFVQPRRPAPPPSRQQLQPTFAQPVSPTPPAVVMPVAAPLRRAAPITSDGGGKILSEIRTGVLAHDQGPFSHNKESGAGINLEMLFVSPDFLDVIWSPRPHIGLTGNTDGDTSQAYLGLSWEWSFWDDWLAGFSLGGAVHNGKTRTDDPDRKELGCRVLFRESIEFGYRILERHALTLFFDHISNAKLCDTNEGLESVGLRYGYRF